MGGGGENIPNAAQTFYFRKSQGAKNEGRLPTGRLLHPVGENDKILADDFNPCASFQ